MLVPVPPEPLPPAGISTSALHAALVAALGPDLGDQFFMWFTVDEPVWGRTAAKQADTGVGWCKARNATQAAPGK
jgi:hypothetical protein